MPSILIPSRPGYCVAALLWCAFTPVLGAGAATNEAQSAASTTKPVITHAPSGVEWVNGPVVVRITSLRSDIVRVQIGRNGILPADESWTVLPTSREARVRVEALDAETESGFSTPSVMATVGRATGSVKVSDSTGHVLLADLARPVMADPPGDGFALAKVIPGDAHYFGLGDKFGPLDRLGHSYVNWNTDASEGFGFQESTDPLYKTLPFFVGYTDGRYFGVFLDNTWRTAFDFGKAQRDVLRMSAEGGPIDYYVMAGPTPKDVMQAYAWLAGPPVVQPRWALGYQQSKWGYKSEAEVRDIVARLRKDRIPTDAIHLDIEYQDGYLPFTYDPRAFPTFPKMIKDFAADHVHAVINVGMFVGNRPNTGYAPYDEGIAQDRFLKNPDGSYYLGKTWLGGSLFADVTRSSTRAWWGTLYRQFAVDYGVSGLLFDLVEPQIFGERTKTMPLDVQHRIEEPGFVTRTTTHREVHNIVGMQAHRMGYEGLLALKPNERPYVISRSSFAGGQRYGTIWTGDNASTYNHLRLTTPHLLSLGLGGFAFASADMGGFNTTASPDFMTKWLEVAMFTPIIRNHNNGTFPASAPQEPWADGKEQEDIRRRFIEERYRLMPYIYTLAEEASRTGVPLMRPMFMEFPEGFIDSSPMDLRAPNQFMWGRALMVAPQVVPEDPTPYQVKFPAGNWYDYWTGKEVTALKPVFFWNAGAVATLKDEGIKSPHYFQVTPQLDQLPVFVRAGSIIPRQGVVQSTEETPSGPLELDVYPGPNCQGSVYTDDGHSFDFRKGVFHRIALSCSTPTQNGLTVRVGKPEGTYQPWWHAYHVVVHGMTQRPRKVLLNGKVTRTSDYDAEAETVAIVVPASAEPTSLTLNWN